MLPLPLGFYLSFSISRPPPVNAWLPLCSAVLPPSALLSGQSHNSNTFARFMTPLFISTLLPLSLSLLCLLSGLIALSLPISQWFHSGRHPAFSSTQPTRWQQHWSMSTRPERASAITLSHSHTHTLTNTQIQPTGSFWAKIISLCKFDRLLWYHFLCYFYLNR